MDVCFTHLRKSSNQFGARGQRCERDAEPFGEGADCQRVRISQAVPREKSTTTDAIRDLASHLLAEDAQGLRIVHDEMALKRPYRRHVL